MTQVYIKVVQAQDLLAQGKVDAALASAQRLVVKHPADPDINTLMSIILARLGRMKQAVFYAERAVQARPNDASLYHNLGLVIAGTDQAGEAEGYFERALELEPSLTGARLAIVNCLLDKHRAGEAVEQCRIGLSYTEKPNAQLSVSYANALLSISDVEEAVEFLREVVKVHPDEGLLVGGLAVALNNLYGADPRELAEAHRAYGRLVDRVRPAFRVSYSGKRDKDRRLRVGIVSPDLRQHSVSFFIEPFFELHDRSAFELIAYSTTRVHDHVSKRLSAHTSLWRDCGAMTAVETARRIADDHIDIALELAGHTDGANLPALNLRPAPVQATYLGYPDTTGLSTIDYRIVDSFTDPVTAPAGEISFDERATEKLLRLDPCFLCFRPPADAPAPFRDPAFPGPVFGSFNATKKVNRALIGLWARVLQATPGSQLLLKAFDLCDPAVPARITSRFGALGIDPARLIFMPATPGIAEHLAVYSRLDVGLDPLPYNGTTTTCEALWMGVPVVTLAGRTHAGRVGVSLLNNVGAPELVTHSEDEYVSVASRLAVDAQRLAHYRTSLRGMMAASPLRDATGFASRLGAALRGMWHSYCDGAR